MDIVPPRLPHLARLPGPGAGGPPGAAQGQGLREQDSGWTVPEDLLLQVGTQLMVAELACMDMDPPTCHGFESYFIRYFMVF